MSLASVPPELPDPENPSATTGLVTTYDTEIVEPEQAAAAAAGALPAGKPRSTFRRGLEVFLENKLAVTGVGHLRLHAAVLLRRPAGVPH